MTRARERTLFLLLILAQAAHSIEEYAFKLYEVFAPARFVSGLFNDDLRVGFAIANTLLVAFGLWCYFARVRPAHPSAAAWTWPWAVVEAINGLTHPLIALARGTYFPGAYTAPLLLALAVYLGRDLARQSSSPGATL